MSGFESFLTGFLNKTTEGIDKRKAQADEYFSNQMQLAFENVHRFRKENKVKAEAALSAGRKLQSVGVPDDIVMAVANQNPDDLERVFNQVQKWQLEGIATTPESLRGLMKIDGEFNPGSENLASLIDKMYGPLTNNIKANPKEWEFDPEGLSWSTMMGYDAMQQAYNKLDQTQIAPGVSASDAAFSDGFNSRPLGDASVIFDAPSIGQQFKNVKDEGPLSPSQIVSITSEFTSRVDALKSSPEIIGLDEPDRTPEASRRAALEIIQDIPQAAGVASISKWLKKEDASGSPGEGRTDPVDDQATALPDTPTEAVSGLPKGSVMVREFPNGDKGYMGPDGKKYLVKKGSAPAQDSTSDYDYPAYKMPES